MYIPTYQERKQRICDRQTWLNEFRDAQRVEMEAKSWAKRQIPMPLSIDPQAYRSFPQLRSRISQAQNVVRELTYHANKAF